MWKDPRIAGHVRYRVVASYVLAPGKPAIEDSVQTRSLLDVAIDGIGDFFRRVMHEVMVLAGHRPQTAHLPEQPLQGVDAAAQIPRKEAAGFFREV